MTLTGRQIREARALLGLRPSDLARKAGCITALGIKRAEENAGGSTLSEDVGFVLRRTLEGLGVEFMSDDEPCVRLRKDVYSASDGE